MLTFRNCLIQKLPEGVTLLDHGPRKLVSARVHGSRGGPPTSVLCTGAGYAGAEQGVRVDGELGGAGRLGKKRGPVGMGRGATDLPPLWQCCLDAWLWLWLRRVGPSLLPEGEGWQQGLGSRASWGSSVGCKDLRMGSSPEGSGQGGPLCI